MNISDFKEILIIGAGANALALESFVSFSPAKEIKVSFLYGFEEKKIEELKQRTVTDNILFLFHSKSGESVEPILLFHYLNSEIDLKHAFFISDNDDSSLIKLAKSKKLSYEISKSSLPGRFDLNSGLFYFINQSTSLNTHNEALRNESFMANLRSVLNLKLLSFNLIYDNHTNSLARYITHLWNESLPKQLPQASAFHFSSFSHSSIEKAFQSPSCLNLYLYKKDPALLLFDKAHQWKHAIFESLIELNKERAASFLQIEIENLKEVRALILSFQDIIKEQGELYGTNTMQQPLVDLFKGELRKKLL